MRVMVVATMDDLSAAEPVPQVGGGDIAIGIWKPGNSLSDVEGFTYIDDFPFGIVKVVHACLRGKLIKFRTRKIGRKNRL